MFTRRTALAFTSTLGALGSLSLADIALAQAKYP